MPLLVIINTILCILGTLGGAFFAVGSIVSIADMTVPWVGYLVVAALLVPAFFILSGIGAWFAHGQGNPRLTIGMVAMPWVYLAAFIIVMLLSFKQ